MSYIDKPTEETPVVLYAYNRPIHTRKTLESLAKNIEARKTSIFAFVDGPKHDRDTPLIKETKNILRSFRGFSEINITERKHNLGLRKNIEQGNNTIYKRYNQFIVLEDDIVVSKHFLSYMNNALLKYRDNKEVWQINSWAHASAESDPKTAYFSRFPSCWGWGTWSDRWSNYKRDPKQLINDYSKKDIWHFNFNGSQNTWKQVKLNAAGKLDTWAVFWYAAIFSNKGLCLCPPVQLSTNIGFDGSGTNCGKYEMLQPLNNVTLQTEFPNKIEEDAEAFKRTISHLKKERFRYISSRIRQLISKLKRSKCSVL